MIEQGMREDTDYRVTIDQIGRLERALLSMRQSAVGSPYTLDVIARIQYQEIARMRAELDSALGFNTQEASDLVMSLQGPHVGFGVAPVSVIAAMLQNFRGAAQSVSSYLTNGKQEIRGRPPAWISQSTDFEFAGVSSGSVQIRLNLPKPQTLFAEEDRESAEKGVILILDTVNWASSNRRIDEFETSIGDEDLVRLLLTQVRRVIPSQNGIVQRVEFSGRLANPVNSYILSHSSAGRIKNALTQVSSNETIVVEEGKLKAVDVDRRRFTLRNRPDSKPDLSCDIPDEILLEALGYLVRDAFVRITGVQHFDDRARPSYLAVEDIQEL